MQSSNPFRFAPATGYSGANTLAAQTIHGYASAAKPGNPHPSRQHRKALRPIGGNSLLRDRNIDVWVMQRDRPNRAHDRGSPADSRTYLDESFGLGSRKDRVLFCGDCLISAYVPNLDAGSPADWPIWLDSLDRVEALHPAIVVAGHGPVAEGGEVAAIIATVRNVLKESIARGSSPTAIPHR